MHAGEELADHLEGGAVAGFVAQLIQGCGHGLQSGSRLVECRRASGCKDGQRPVGRTLGAAADRRIEVMAAGFLEAFRKTACDVGVHRR